MQSILKSCVLELTLWIPFITRKNKRRSSKIKMNKTFKLQIQENNFST